MDAWIMKCLNCEKPECDNCSKSSGVNGRPSRYDYDKMDFYMRAYPNGGRITKIAQMENVCRRTVMRWERKYEKESEGRVNA